MSNRRISYSSLLTILLLLAACIQSPGPSNSVVQPTPPSSQQRDEAGPTPPGAEEEQPIDEVQFFGNGEVSLCRKGSELFEPLVTGSFRSGDRLRIGSGSSARVLCPDRLCQLTTGEYNDCCGPTCAVIAQMMRSGAGENAPTIRKAELPANEAITLAQSEANIRNLHLGPVTTQFLVTKLYSGWKLEETKEELDRLTVELEKPAAKLELKSNYDVVKRKTGDMQLKVNRVDKATELYRSNLESPTADPVEKANTRTRLAEADEKRGEPEKAIRNLEIARDGYIRQQENKAAEITDKKIERLRMTAPVNRSTPTPTKPVRIRQP